MYTGYELTQESRNMLLSKFPPKNPTVLGHHITEQFGVPSDHPPPEPPSEVLVVGYIEAEGLEGLLVSVNGRVHRPTGGKYHITWSIDKNLGRKPVDTNKFVDTAQPVDSIRIDTVPKTFTKSTEKSLKEDTFLDFFKAYS